MYDIQLSERNIVLLRSTTWTGPVEFVESSLNSAVHCPADLVNESRELAGKAGLK